MTAAVSVLLVTGCAASSSPGDEVPALAETLSAVDDAIAAERYAQARNHLETLVATTEDARASGDLAEDDADRVLAAAARLMAVLPAGSGKEPAPEPTTTSEPPADPFGQDPGGSEGDGDGEGNGDGDGEGEGDGDGEGEGDGDGEGGKDENKKLKEERKKLEEERKELDKGRTNGNGVQDGGGNGDSSRNGPDDGHGS